jgi:peptidoglycan/xylan/chitin deacetylase (PgdA/CDA1 family)
MTFPFVKRRRSRNVQILTYHRVNDDHDPFFPATPLHVFEKQMEYLAANFNVCHLDEAVERMRKRDVPDNTVVITFDDGYRDNYLNAFPVLKRLSVPVTIFLATDAIEYGSVLWHDRVFSAFRETRVPFLKEYGRMKNEYSLLTLGEKLLAQKEVLKFLRSLDEAERLIWVDRLIERLSVDNLKERSDLMLTWEEVRIMHRAGVSFGSHTVTHPILSKIPMEKAREEVERSKQLIEERLGAPVQTFAYPNGTAEDFNVATKQMLKEAGYLCAVTTIFGTNKTGQDLFELQRGKPWEEDLPSFALKLNWYEFCFQSE